MEPEKGVENGINTSKGFHTSIPGHSNNICPGWGRFYWYPQIPLYITIIGMFLYTLGQIIILRAKMVNKYFSAVVRIQTDRGHTVCKEGPTAS